ncbi:MAG: hypothetical protein OEZ39_16325 [Gammaproteobacteria bacterium]|nr:hypothetical protein [Gammaproteobacteria bacterium]MDH5653426.1 hypothetical protein [Gammaproteobacteria bacterium]
MRLLELLIFFVLLFSSAASADSTIDKKIESISANLELLQNDTGNIKLWKEYISVFPTNKSEFKVIYDPDDFSNLYNNSHKYILIFEKAPNELKDNILQNHLNIVKNGAPGCCDAWSFLHKIISDYSIIYE